ncbi:MAG: GNAT family N-acetyltransferase [Clostridiales bacterium]|nr:GNAT family N-acetyltransferase [Clostridiales bacterium]
MCSAENSQKYTAHIFSLGILEQYHKQGIGHRLLEAIERYCLDNGYFLPCH